MLKSMDVQVLYSWGSTSVDMESQLYICWNIFTYKWTCTVQAHVVKGQLLFLWGFTYNHIVGDNRSLISTSHRNCSYMVHFSFSFFCTIVIQITSLYSISPSTQCYKYCFMQLSFKFHRLKKSYKYKINLYCCLYLAM